MNQSYGSFETTSESELEEIVHGSSSSSGENNYYEEFEDDEEELTASEDYRSHEDVSTDPDEYYEESYYSVSELARINEIQNNNVGSTNPLRPRNDPNDDVSADDGEYYEESSYSVALASDSNKNKNDATHNSSGTGTGSYEEISADSYTLESYYSVPLAGDGNKNKNDATNNSHGTGAGSYEEITVDDYYEESYYSLKDAAKSSRNKNDATNNSNGTATGSYEEITVDDNYLGSSYSLQEAAKNSKNKNNAANDNNPMSDAARSSKSKNNATYDSNPMDYAAKNSRRESNSTNESNSVGDGAGSHEDVSTDPDEYYEESYYSLKDAAKSSKGKNNAIEDSNPMSDGTGSHEDVSTDPDEYYEESYYSLKDAAKSSKGKNNITNDRNPMSDGTGSHEDVSTDPDEYYEESYYSLISKIQSNAVSSNSLGANEYSQNDVSPDKVPRSSRSKKNAGESAPLSPVAESYYSLGSNIQSNAGSTKSLGAKNHSQDDVSPDKAARSSRSKKNAGESTPVSPGTGSMDGGYSALDQLGESHLEDSFIQNVFEENDEDEESAPSMASNDIVSENEESSFEDMSESEVDYSDAGKSAKYDADVDGSSHQSSSASSYSAEIKDDSRRRFYQPRKQSPPRRIIRAEEGSLGISSTSFRSSSLANKALGDSSINSISQTPATKLERVLGSSKSTLGSMRTISESDDQSEASEMLSRGGTFHTHSKRSTTKNNNRRGKKSQRVTPDHNAPVGSSPIGSSGRRSEGVSSQDNDPPSPSKKIPPQPVPRAKKKVSRPQRRKHPKTTKTKQIIIPSHGPFNDSANGISNGKNGRCPSIAVLGTMSGTGKSVIAAALCRIFANAGTKCAPFKSHNTGSGTAPALLPELSRRDTLYGSFSAMVKKQGYKNGTKNGSTLLVAPTKEQGYGQIGMAQSLQAEACRIVPRVEMNPIFLKYRGTNEKGESMCDMVVMGKQFVRETYGGISRMVPTMQNMVLSSHLSLARATCAEVIVIQGAGSCSELNLMDGDIVNLPLVRCLQCPWLLVANDELGGVFAQVIGTKMCVSKRDWDLCMGVIVNKVRGDIKEFLRGLKMLKKMTGKPLYAMPFVDDLEALNGKAIDIERRLAWEKKGRNEKDRQYEANRLNKITRNKPTVVVVAYPHSTISNDLYPLERDSRFHLEWRRKRLPKPYPTTTTVILPGSRLPLLDLKWLQDTGWAEFVRKHVAAGGSVLGLCAGYQMLGWNVQQGPHSKHGIGLLPITSTAEPAECQPTEPTKGQLYPSGVHVEGFELNCGFSEIVESEQKNVVDGKYEGLAPLIAYENGKPEGMRLGRVHGTYLHGILRSAKARVELLAPFPDRKQFHSILEDFATEDPLDKFANHLQSSGLDYNTLREVVFAESSSAT